MPIVSAIFAFSVLGQEVLRPIDNLDIPLPQGAVASFEVDARDDDLLATVKQFIASMGNGVVGVVPNRTPLGSMLNSQTLGAILKNVHRIHAVSFKGAPADLLSFYEPALTQQGAHRMIFMNGNNPILLMRTESPLGLTAIVKTNNDAFIVRTEGLPDMALLGKLAGGFVGGMSKPSSMPAKVAPATRPVVPPKKK